MMLLAGALTAQNIFPGSGGAGIGTTSPTDFLDIVVNSGGNGGIVVTNSATEAAWLRLKSSGTGYGDWIMAATGSGNTEGNGRFVIHNAKTTTTPFLIDPSGNVGIGTISPSARLHAVGTTLGIKGDAGGNMNDIGVQGTGFFGVDGNGGLIGVRGSSYGSGYVGLKTGVRGGAAGGASNSAGYFQAGGGPAGVVSYGVYSEIPLSTLGLGGTNYGIYATVSGNNNLGAGPNYAGYFDGDVVTAGGSYFYSDGRLKKNITGINNSLSIIKKLNPVNYNFDFEGNKNLALPVENQYGFISQEVQKILPEFTKTLIHPAKLDDEGNEIYPKKEVLGLNYNGFIALLTKGMQEQQEHIETLEKQLDEQKELINALSQKSSNTTGINSINSIETGFQISQNEPNPFTYETVVKYTMPETVKNAFMVVYDLTGKQITTFTITEKGSSSLIITSEKLAAGIYIYSIVADGKVIDSKRMIVAEK